ncbi:MAG: DMT family transporter [Oscillatoria sp. PMC 1051.18]|nr:DMT family transporter [Oscillatoria sp. PMC 1050.18]MEC5029155.1 DMT family transporter [Oscillatoria sp. PMC 1051.18]
MTNQLQYFQVQPERKTTTIALISLLIAIIAISISPILIRLTENEISPDATIFFREAIAAVIFGIWSSFNSFNQRNYSTELRAKSSNEIKQLIALIAAAIIATVSVIFFAWSLTQTSVANCTIIYNLVPIFTTLGAWLIFNQRFNSTFLIGMIIAISGAIAIGLQDLQISVNHLQGDLFSLLSVILYAGYLLLVEKLRKNLDAATILLWRCGVGSILLLAIVLLAGEELFPVSFGGWLAAISLAIVSQVIGQGLIAYTLNKLSSSFVAISFLLIPTLAAILAWFIFDEKLNLLNILSFLVVLLGMYFALSSKDSVNK